MMQHDPLSILTPFSLKSAKKWDSAAQKTEFDKGGSVGGLKIKIWVKYLISHHILLIFVADVYLFEVKESSSESFAKILTKRPHTPILT